MTEQPILEHGLRLAEAIIQSEKIAEKIQAEVKIEIPKPEIQYVFKELPKPLSAYYNSHQYQTVSAGDRVTVWYFEVPPNHIFHIEQIGTNWFEDCKWIFEVDGRVLETIEHFYGSINAPVDVKHRFIYASRSVRWLFENNSSDDVIAEVVCDGTVYLRDDFFEAAKRGFIR